MLGTYTSFTFTDGSEAEVSVMRDGQPATGETVRLVNTDYQSVVDADGRYEITDLIPGPYEIGVADSLLADVGIIMTTGRKFTATRGAVAIADFDAPAIVDHVGTQCAAAELRRATSGTGVLIGRIALPNGAPAAAASWVIMSPGTEDLRGDTDEQGMFRVCSVPRGATLVIVASRFGVESRMTVNTANQITIVKVTLGAP